MLNHKTYVETHLKPNEKVVLNTETTAKGLIVTWLAFPGGFLIYWLITYLPIYIRSLFSSAMKEAIMNALEISDGSGSGAGFSMSYVSDYVVKTIWDPIPGFFKFLIIFPLVLLFLVWLGLNLVLTWRHFRYALAITDSRVIGFAGSQEMDVPYDQLVDCFVEQSLWGKIFGYGTVRVQTKRLTLEFHNRKNPKKIAAAFTKILDGEY